MKVKPGDPLRIHANDWNTLLGVAEQAKLTSLLTTSGRGLAGVHNGILVPIKNNTGATLARYHAIGIGDPLFTHADNADTFLNQLGFKGEEVDLTYLGKFAVMQETTPDQKVGRGLLQGITVAEITVNHEDHDRVDVDTDGGPKLVSQFYGAGEILYKESGTGTKWAIVRVGAFISEQLKAIADEDIEAGASGDVTIQRGGVATETVTAHLNWMAGSEDVTADLELLIRFYRDENAYVIEAAECPPPP
jgi:hypothetical protein